MPKKPKSSVVEKQLTNGPLIYTYTKPDGSQTVSRNAPTYFKYLKGPRVPPGNLFTHVAQPYSGVYYVLNDGFQCDVQGSNSGCYEVSPEATSYLWQGDLDALNNKKLPTSNQAGLLQNLAELDDTVAMFGKKLASSISYGGYKWGWSPLLSDIAAVNDVCNRVKEATFDGSRISAKYVDQYKLTRSTPKPIVTLNGSFAHKWEVTIKYDGYITYDHSLLSYYDFVGFHPSPKLIWDLVPMSFAVDWVLPIGDMLKNITPSQGWVRAANFTGWKMIRARCVETMVRPGHYAQLPIPRDTTYFYRNYVASLAMETKTFAKEIGLKIPTLEQAFDIGFLANTLFNSPKKKPRRERKPDGLHDRAGNYVGRD